VGEKVRGHIRSNVIGYVALFVALSGTAYAVDGPLPGQDQVGSADIINAEVTNKDLAPNSVTSAKIFDREVKNADLSFGASSSNTIADGGIQGIDVKNDTLTGTQVDDNSLTEADINEGTLDTALRLDYDQPETDSTPVIVGTQNELTIRAFCDSAPTTELLVQTLTSVAGSISWMLSTDTGGGAPIVTNGGAGLAADSGFEPFALAAPTGSFQRGEAQVVYRNDNRVISLDLHMIANDSTGRCQVQGTAVEAS
jgi:hypothetical protein